MASHLDSQFVVDTVGLVVDSRDSDHVVDTLRDTEIAVVAAESEVVHQFVVAADYFVLMEVVVGRVPVLHDRDFLPAADHPWEVV